METVESVELSFSKEGAYSFIDLFCGAGGFSLGFQKAGFGVMAGYDNWDKACEVYQRNVGLAHCRDVRTLGETYWESWKKPFVLIGSPPCRTFSKANIKTRECDVTLVAEFFRIVKILQPKVWVMENVPEVYDFVTAPHKYLFDTSLYGMLQRRVRFFCSNIPLQPAMPEEKYLDDEQLERLARFRPSNIHKKFGTVVCRYNSFVKTQPHFEDESGIKVMNHEEAMQLQTFPFDFEIPKDLNQREIENLVGNAVPPFFAYKIAKCVLEYLETGGGKVSVEPGVRKAVQRGFFE